MEINELIQWLRDNSSGVYRPAAEAADRLERMSAALELLKNVNLSEDNCADFKVANRRIRNIAATALQ